MKFALLIFKYFPFGGMQRDMLRIAGELAGRGHRVEIFTISWQGARPQQAGIVVHELPVRGLFNYRRYQRFIARARQRMALQAAAGAPFDLVVGFNRMEGLDVYFAADPCFVERAHRQRGWLYRQTPRYRWFAGCERAIFAATAATEILLLSDTEKNRFQAWYQTPSARFHFIPPFLAAERFAPGDREAMRRHLRENFGFGTDEQVCLLVGSGFAMKGLDRAIRALAALPAAQRAATRLVAVGQDNPRPFMKMARTLGVARQVVISPGRPDIPALMQGADVYIHPAYRENTGLVILEALACGLPALVTASCGYAFHVRAADAGLVADEPFNQHAFDRQLLQLLTSPERARWRDNGLSYARRIMADNDGGAEARTLIEIAAARRESGRR